MKQELFYDTRENPQTDVRESKVAAISKKMIDIFEAEMPGCAVVFVIAGQKVGDGDAAICGNAPPDRLMELMISGMDQMLGVMESGTPPLPMGH